MNLDNMTFDQWFWELSDLAQQQEVELGHKDQYKEYYDDGDSPEDALAAEINAQEQ